MASNLLMNISQDERERAVFRSRRMYQSDMDSNIATIVKKHDFEIARNMLAAGEPVEKVMKYFGLSREEVENQRIQ